MNSGGGYRVTIIEENSELGAPYEPAPMPVSF
jgi:hypothetical protein